MSTIIKPTTHQEVYKKPVSQPEDFIFKFEQLLSFSYSIQNYNLILSFSFYNTIFLLLYQMPKVYGWEFHRDTLGDLNLVQNATLTMIIALIETRHGFNPRYKR